MFIDDLAFHGKSDSTADLAKDLVDAVIDFSVDLEHTLGMELARKKTAVISNDNRTAAIVRKSLRDLGGPALSTVRSLGIDFAGGNSLLPELALSAGRDLSSLAG